MAALDRKIASLSGSTDAGDIAELRKLQAERAELQEGLDDTYYNHSKDAQSKALEDEMEAYQKASDDLIENLREGLKDVGSTFERLITTVALNSSVIISQITDTAEENGVTLSDSLTNPWLMAQQGEEEFAIQTDNVLSGLIGDNGVITLWSDEAYNTLTKPFLDALIEGTGPLAQFESGVNTTIDNVKIQVNGKDGTSGYLGTSLTDPWTEAVAEDGPITTFDETVGTAIDNAIKKVNGEDGETNYLGDAVAKPWEDGSTAVNTFSTDVETEIESVKKKVLGENLDGNYLGDAVAQPWKDGSSAANTFATDVGKALDKAIATTKTKMAELNAETAKYTPSYTGKDNNTNNNTNNNSTNNNKNNSQVSADVKQLQKFLNTGFGAGLTVDGKYGTSTTKAVENAQRVVNSYYKDKIISPDGKYGSATKQAFEKYWNDKASKDRQNREWWEKNWKGKLPTPMYAKGTLGTKKDEWAITDESWIGEEITLAAGKNGQLQYLKKGSAVMPADISANLVEWGKLDPNMMAMGNIGANLNMISNAVVQPNYEFNFDSLVHVDHCDEGTLKNLEKMVDTKINDFSKQLNYSIKKFAR